MDIELDSDLVDMLEVDIDGSTIVPYSFEPLRTERNEEDGESSGRSDSDSEHESSDNGRPVSEWYSICEFHNWFLFEFE